MTCLIIVHEDMCVDLGADFDRNAEVAWIFEGIGFYWQCLIALQMVVSIVEYRLESNDASCAFNILEEQTQTRL